MAYSQPGIFNVLDYAIYPGELGNASNNTVRLQQLIYLVQSLGGGTILFPSQFESGGANYTVYKFNGTIGVGPPASPSPVSMIFAGTGQGTESQTTLLMEANEDLFEVDTGSPEQDLPVPGGDEHVGGITFQDLSIKYDNGTSGTAIDAISGENVRVLRVVFVDCPQAVWFADTLQCSMFECTAVYSGGSSPTVPNPACVTLGLDESGVAAKEIYIASCTFLSHQVGGTGLIIQGAEHVRVMNVRLEGFSEGINITPGAAISGGQNTLKHHFGNVTVFTYNPSGPTGPALTIQPQGPQNVSEIVFAECTFEPSQSGVSAGPGVYIDQGAYGATVTDIRFVSCRATRWTGPGIEIATGSNIEITGGFYSGNAPSGSPSGGISITGPASAIRIVGAACIGSYPYIINYGSPMESPLQQVGIYIAGAGASNVIIDHCDLTGNSQHAVLIAAGGLSVSSVFIRSCNAGGYGTLPSNAIVVVGEVSDIQITDCAGYNDKAATLSTSAPSGTFSNISFGYYGPIAFYAAPASGGTPLSITIDGVVTGLTSGGFTLSPGESAGITGTPSKFLAVGK